jgi:hypothetical protein
LQQQQQQQPPSIAAKTIFSSARTYIGAGTFPHTSAVLQIKWAGDVHTIKYCLIACCNQWSQLSAKLQDSIVDGRVSCPAPVCKSVG